MAVPTTRELALKRKGSMYNNNKNFKIHDKSRYLALKHDYEHNNLPLWKEDEYLKLKEIYENETK